jgi:hypothetical protein
METNSLLVSAVRLSSRNQLWAGSAPRLSNSRTRPPPGKLANQLLCRHDEPRLEVVEEGRPWSFDGDGALLRLKSEAQRIHRAPIFDPVLAVHTSLPTLPARAGLRRRER